MAAGLLEIGEVMLTASERRLEISARNVSNISTPGYKRQISFEQAMDGANVAPASAATFTDMSSGVVSATGRRFDLALTSPGFFAVASDDNVSYTRAGQFERAPDGRLVNPMGLALQSDDGGDVIIHALSVEITEDGAVLEDGAPTARIGVFQASAAQMQSVDGALFSAPIADMAADPAPRLRQGALESANVDMGAEMVTVMGTMRQAEAGARVVQAYDTLIGQAISNLARGGR